MKLILTFFRCIYDIQFTTKQKSKEKKRIKIQKYRKIKNTEK